MSLFLVRPHTAVRIIQPFFEALIKSRGNGVRCCSAVHFNLPITSLTTTEILVFNPREAKHLSGQAGYLVVLIYVMHCCKDVSKCLQGLAQKWHEVEHFT